MANSQFDREYGVTTQAILFLGDLDPDDVGDAGAHATHYEAVPPNDFRALISHVPIGIIERSACVDIGAGMGRAMLLAAEHPFKYVLGIEVSAGLYEVTKENLAHARPVRRACNDLRVVRADARIHEYPPGDLVVFAYNPFDAVALEATAGALLSRRDRGDTWFLYHTPVARAVIDADPRWSIVAEIPSGVVYRA